MRNTSVVHSSDDPPRKRGVQLLAGVILGAVRGGIILLLSLDLSGAILVLLLSAAFSIVAGASAIATRRPRGHSTSRVSFSLPTIVAAAVTLAVVTYASWHSLTHTAIVCAAALLVDLALAKLGWPVLARVMRARGSVAE
jgi:hypothetical protein